jgi:hypothetical protein
MLGTSAPRSMALNGALGAGAGLGGDVVTVGPA